MKWFTGWWLGLSLVFLAGCTTLQPVEVVRVDGLSGLKITRGGMEGGLVLILNNPNPVTIQAEAIDVEVAINGQRVGTVELPFAQAIPKGENQQLELTVAAETQALLAVLQENLIQFLTGKEVTVGVEGAVRGSALGIGVSIPVSTEQNLKIQL